MNEDPAIKQATALWNARQPKEAMLLLFERINELNQQLAASSAPNQTASPPDPKREISQPTMQTHSMEPGEGYIAQSLVSGEYLIFRTGLHWWAAVAPPLITFILCWLVFAFLFLFMSEPSWILLMVCPAAGLGE